MTEQKQDSSAAIHTIPQQPADKAITLRVPRPNMQIAVLGLVAFITLFQTVQLVRISSSGTTSVKAAPAATSAVSQPSTGGGSGSDASTTQSMVGGC